MRLHGILWFFGVYPIPAGTSAMYQLWSGFIPALAVLTLIGSVAGLYHLHNCHHDHCWRIGKHKVSGTPWCNRHHASARPERGTDDLLREVSATLGQLVTELREAREARPPARTPASRSKRATAP